LREDVTQALDELVALPGRARLGLGLAAADRGDEAANIISDIVVKMT
jgi:hypothetical protein